MRLDENEFVNFLRPSSSPFSFSHKGLSQDFFLDTFYYGENANLGSGDVAKKIDFSGNYIQVLNSWIPGNFENIFAHYHFDRNQIIEFANPVEIIIPKVIPIFANTIWEYEYEFLYRTQDLAGVQITNSLGWGFTYNPLRSTPILSMLSKECRYIQAPKFKSENFIHSLGSVISEDASGEECVLTFRHGGTDLVQFHVEIDTLVNPLTITFKQLSPDGIEWTDQVLTIFGGPYSNMVTLPQRFSYETNVEVLGGGVGETGGITINCILSPRG